MAENTTKIKEALSVSSNCDIQTLINKSNEIASQCKDYMVVKANNSNVRFNESAGLTFMLSNGEVKNLGLTHYSLSQLSTKLGIPTRYIEKCVNSGRINLAQDNINSWLEDYNKDLFIRGYNDQIRGVLSSKYSVCDSPEILKVVDDAVDLSNYKVKGSFLNEERLHLRLIGKEMLPIDGEDLFAGLFIDSSDVGRSILTVKFGIYKQVCTNGLVIAKSGGVLFEQKHIGITAEEFHKGLTNSLKTVDELTEHAIEWVEYAKNCKAHNTMENTEEFLAYIRQQTNLSEENANKVIYLMKDRYDMSRWGLINGITEVAQDFTLERRLELERMAGNLLVA